MSISSTLKILVINMVVMVVFVALLELGGRVWLWAITDFDPQAFAYGPGTNALVVVSASEARFQEAGKATGPDQARELQLELTEYEQNGFCDGMHQKKMGHELTARAMYGSEAIQSLLSDPQYQGRKIRIWAFGGSTTYGNTCGEDSSSWPLELMYLDPERLEVVNYGGNGFSSDQAIDKAYRKLSEHAAPDVVLWSNFPNEFDILFFLMERNIETLKQEFPQIDTPELLTRISDRNAWRHQGRRLMATLAKYSACFRLVRDLYRINVVGVDTTRKQDPGMTHLFEDKGVAFTVRNHLINLHELEELASEYGFRIIAVRPPRNWSMLLLESGELPFGHEWAKGFNRDTFQYYRENGIPIIDTQSILEASGHLTPR